MCQTVSSWIFFIRCFFFCFWKKKLIGFFEWYLEWALLENYSFPILWIGFLHLHLLIHCHLQFKEEKKRKKICQKTNKKKNLSKNKQEKKFVKKKKTEKKRGNLDQCLLDSNWLSKFHKFVWYQNLECNLNLFLIILWKII